jgi:tight adherence protein B
MIEALVRIAILLAAFASVFLLVQTVLGQLWASRTRFAAINHRLELIRKGATTEQVMVQLRKNQPIEFVHLPIFLRIPLAAMQRTLFASAVRFTMSQLLLGMLTLSVGSLLIGFLVCWLAGVAMTAGTALLLVILAVIIGVFIPLMVLSNKAQRRRKKIEDQFPVSLDIFVRALRSGHPVASAIELLTREMEDPIGSEYGLVADEVAFGADLNEAIESMANRWDLEDIRMFVVSLSVQIETGGNLAEILENLAEVIRARASLYRKVRSLSAEGRMTGWMLTALPVITFLGMFTVNPAFYLNVSRDPIFLFGFPSLIVLYFIGVMWIRHLVNIKV